MSVLMKNGNNYTGSTSGGGGATNLNGLSDVEVSSPSNGQVLSYDSSTAKWENGSVPIASANTVGGIKVGQNLSIQSDGTLSATGGGGGGSSYSTSEQVIGTWINGETLYQRTFTGTFPSSVSASGDGITISSFSYWSGLKEIKATIKWKEGTAYGITNIPYTDNNSAMLIVQSQNRGVLEFWAVNKNSGLNTFYNQPYVVTIKYTK